MSRRPALAGLVAATVAALLVPLAPASPAAASQTGVSGDASPVWQPNGIAWSVATAAGGVWVAGDFTRIRPPGAAAGVGEIARFHVAVLDAASGNPLPVTYASNNRTTVAEANADRSRVYLGGTFTTFGGVAHSGVVAVDAASRGVVHAFAPQVTGEVKAIAATGSVVYLGGVFTAVNGVPRQNLAAVDAATGALLPWNPGADGPVFTLEVGSASVWAGGDFDRLAGAAQHAIGAVHPVTGALQPFPAAAAVPPRATRCVSKVKDIELSAGVVHVGAEGTGGSCFDGTFAARESDGALLWRNSCFGATQTVQPFAGMLVRGSHTHTCAGTGDPDAFPEMSRLRLQRRFLSGQDLSTGFLMPWYPEIGVDDPKKQLGPFGMDTDGSQLFVAGDFSTVNGVRQTFLTRFAPGDSPTPAPSAPVVTRTGPGQLTVYVRPPVDRDDTDLVIDVFRGSSTTPVASLPTHSLFWRQVPVSVTLTVPPGTAPQFRASARSAAGGPSSARSGLSSPVPAVDPLAAYPTQVLSDGPSFFWRFGDRNGTVLAGDTSPARTTGVITGKVARAVAGVTAEDTAFSFGASTTDLVATPSAVAAPTTFTAELWFSTTATTGGQLLGFGDLPRGNSFTRDRQLYLGSDGRVRYSTLVNGFRVNLASPAAYTDGGWHHVAVTQSPSAVRLYVDGAQVASSSGGTGLALEGYWRVGSDVLNGVSTRPTTDWYTGRVDEVAVYPTELSAARLQAHAATGRLG